MARIPEQVVERVKREVSLAGLVRGSGVELEKVGKELRGRCPWHEGDREPSLFVDEGKGVFHCFGCGAKGTAVDWRMRSEGVGFREAVESLAAEFLGWRQGNGEEETAEGAAAGEGDEGSGGGAVEAMEEERLRAIVEGSREDALGVVAGWYRERFGVDDRARRYLEKRGLGDPELAERFGIGFADRTLGLAIRRHGYASPARRRLIELGVLREGTGHEHLAGSLTAEIRDGAGQVVQLYGRKVTARLRPGTAEHLYLPGPLETPYNLEAFASSELILCEAILDAWTFWAAGFHHVTTTYGAARKLPAWLEAALLGHGVKRVLIAYDRDDAGEAAAEELGKQLGQLGVGAFRITFPRGMDANSYALRVQPAARSLDLLIRRAEWVAGPAGRPVVSGQWLVAGVGTGAVPEQSESSRSDSGADCVLVSDGPGSAAVGAGKERPGQGALSFSSVPLADSGPSSAAKPIAAPSAAVRDLPEAAEEAAAGAEVSAPSAPVRANRQLTTDTTKPDEVSLDVGDRRYRVRGLAKNLSFEVLKVNVLAARGDAFHVDTLDLYSARHRAAYVKAAATELGVKEEVVKGDLGRVLLALEELQEELIRGALEPAETKPTMTAQEREDALELLRDPALAERILADYERCGVVGEETNKLVTYLAATSRLLDRPLAVLIQSGSAAGKSALMTAALELIPEEERIEYSAMTGQSLYYMGEKDLKHKVLAIAEEEGAERASYALKLLQSEGRLSIASTGKDPASGKLVTHEYAVEGPVALLLTTTAIDVDEELLNRCLVLSVDEGREQTRAIHARQRRRETLEGQLEARRRARVRRVHQNAQRLLRPLLVVNPFAEDLGFPDGSTRTRRDHEKYLALIRAIALLFQHQREVREVEDGGERVAYVEVTAADIELANRLAAEVLSRSLDELPPQTRRLLGLLERWVAERCEAEGLEREHVRFTRRELREAIGWGDTQLKVHLSRLVELELVGAHGTGHAQRLAYELLTYAAPGSACELADPESGASRSSDEVSEGVRRPTGRGERETGRAETATGRPLVGGWSGVGPTGFDSAESETSVNRSGFGGNHVAGEANGGASYSIEPRMRRAAGAPS